MRPSPSAGRRARTRALSCSRSPDVIEGKVDDQGNVAEDLRSQILGQLSERLNYDRLYQEALSDPELKRTVPNRDIQMLRDALGNQFDTRDLRGMGSPLKSLGERLLDLNRVGGHAFSRCLRRWRVLLPIPLAVARCSRRNKVGFRSISIVVSRKQL